jgi:hypothetical protein
MFGCHFNPYSKFFSLLTARKSSNLFILTFNRKMGDCCPIKRTSFSPERENAVLQWALKLNTVPAAAAMWDLKGYMLKVNDIS